MSLLTAILMGGANGTVTLSGESIEATAADPQNAIAALRINQDGTVDKVVNTVPTQLDAATDWLVPNGFAPDDYEVRFTNLVGDAPGAGGTAEDEWVPLSAGNFSVTLTQASVGSKACSFDIEIRRGSSGAALDSGSYSLSATVT